MALLLFGCSKESEEIETEDPATVSSVIAEVAPDIPTPPTIETDNEILTEESAKVAFTELYEKNAIFFDAATTPNPTAYEFTGAIPEPTSGLMLLLGLAGLALKRKVA